MGETNIKTDEDVKVDFMDGKTIIYNSKQIQQLILNPICIRAISLLKQS
jgi:hypothetical protein